MVPKPAPLAPDVELTPERLAAHAYALDASGWTVLRSQVDATALDELREAADRALEATRSAIAEGRAGGHTVVDESYVIARRFYRWSDVAFRLLEHPAVQALGARMLGQFHLFDCSTNATYPATGSGHSAGTGWHRDFGSDLHHGSALPSHLFLFFCLDALDERNGGTWVVPGSHRRTQQPEPATFDQATLPSAMRIAASAGDLVVVDPAVLHGSGRNLGESARRLAVVGLCHARVSPACDHWAMLDQRLRESASPGVRNLLSFRWDEGHAAWAVLPDGSIAGPRATGR